MESPASFSSAKRACDSDSQLAIERCQLRILPEIRNKSVLTVTNEDRSRLKGVILVTRRCVKCLVDLLPSPYDEAFAHISIC
jgi:hypothetical protein